MTKDTDPELDIEVIELDRKFKGKKIDTFKLNGRVCWLLPTIAAVLHNMQTSELYDSIQIVEDSAEAHLVYASGVYKACDKTNTSRSRKFKKWIAEIVDLVEGN